MADKFLGTYDPKEVSLLVGVINVSGFFDGTFITVARADNELYKSHVGAHGEMARTKNNNTSGTITFTLKQTSPSRKLLDLAKNNPALVPVLVKNNSDATYIAQASEGWIKTDPDNEFGDEESGVEYVIEVADLNQSTL